MSCSIAMKLKDRGMDSSGWKHADSEIDCWRFPFRFQSHQLPMGHQLLSLFLPPPPQD